ncbi:MAG: hypothetical protein M0Q38_01830 [Bacteroidales bacterium]|jgi:lipid II:glycine glycyltransferase (peptidoglycan interpeptide bridge formation enzyme)|nr:hypothetical protein [Bacteroidales bacterium]
MQIIANEHIDIKSWTKFLKNNSFTSPFQTPEFYQFFNSVEGLSAEVFSIIEKDIIVALVVVTIHKEHGLKGFFSKRGIIYGGPLIEESDTGKVALRILLKHLYVCYKNKLIYLETRNLFDYKPFCEEYKESTWKYVPYCNIKMELRDFKLNDLLLKMKYNRRREISLSIKAGALVKEASNVEEVYKLFDILKSLYSSRVKLPLPDVDYFEKLYASSIGKVFIVQHNGKIIGGCFCIQYPKLSINTLYYAGIRNYDKKVFPTHLAIKGVIEYAINSQIPTVDLMGAGKPDQEYGVRDYKVQFGGNLVEYGRYLKILNPIMYKIGTIGVKMMSKI